MGMNHDHFKRFIVKTFRSFRNSEFFTPSFETKESIRRKALYAYQDRYTQQNISLWHSFRQLISLQSPQFKLAFSFGLFFLGFLLLPLFGTETLAGYVSPKNGAVSLIRGNQTLLLTEDVLLQEGDILHIGHNAEAAIIFPNQFESVIKENTQLKIINHDEIFIEKGMILSESYDNHQFSSTRGFVASSPNSVFTISISETGEMEVISSQNNINVFDWKNGETTIRPGEKISLRTDTLLTRREIPDNLSLSTLQLNSIQAKLIITRTKLINAIERIIADNEVQSEKDLISAQKTFFSVLNILYSSRDMESKKRFHWETFSFQDVINEMERKSVPKSFLEEAQALQSLFVITKDNKKNLAFRTPDTGFQSFDRFVTLERVFQHANNDDHKNILQRKYVIVFLRKILNEPLRIDQVSVMNQEVSKLPKNEESQRFLRMLSEVLPPDLGELLDEKRDRMFAQ